MFARRFVFVLLLAQVGLAGCHHHPCHKLWNNVCRTVKREPKCFDYCDRSAVFHEMACCYWTKNVPSKPCSDHFRGGFLDGFADYLHRGGTGQAPVLPPRHYWEPNGGQCRLDKIEEWRAGFQAGSDSAKESGMREQIVISYDGEPVSDQNVASVRQANFEQAEMPATESSMAPMQMQYTDMPIPAEVGQSPYVFEEVTDAISTGEVVEEPQVTHSIVELPDVEPAEHPSAPEPTIIHLSDELE